MAKPKKKINHNLFYKWGIETYSKNVSIWQKTYNNIVVFIKVAMFTE